MCRSGSQGHPHSPVAPPLTHPHLHQSQQGLELEREQSTQFSITQELKELRTNMCILKNTGSLEHNIFSVSLKEGGAGLKLFPRVRSCCVCGLWIGIRDIILILVWFPGGAVPIEGMQSPHNRIPTAPLLHHHKTRLKPLQPQPTLNHWEKVKM